MINTPVEHKAPRIYTIGTGDYLGFLPIFHTLCHMLHLFQNLYLLRLPEIRNPKTLIQMIIHNQYQCDMGGVKCKNM